jgi:hypothetical protein
VIFDFGVLYRGVKGAPKTVGKGAEKGFEGMWHKCLDRGSIRVWTGSHKGFKALQRHRGDIL